MDVSHLRWVVFPTLDRPLLGHSAISVMVGYLLVLEG